MGGVAREGIVLSFPFLSFRFQTKAWSRPKYGNGKHIFQLCLGICFALVLQVNGWNRTPSSICPNRRHCLKGRRIDPVIKQPPTMGTDLNRKSVNLGPQVLFGLCRSGCNFSTFGWNSSSPNTNFTTSPTHKILTTYQTYS